MKVLQLCLRVPYPPADGGTIAMYNMAMALSKAGAEIRILSLNTKKHFVANDKLPPDFVSRFRPSSVFLDATVKPIPALLNLFSDKSYNISRFDIPEFHAELEKVLKEETFDIIQMESLFMTPYLSTIRNHSKAKVVLRAHNVEYLIWKRLAAAAGNPVRKWYLDFLAERLKNYEHAVLNKLDAIIVLTPDDKQLIEKSGTHAPVLVAPIGLDTEKYVPQHDTSDSVQLFHLGSMDWLPNIEAVDWFLKEVFPMVREKFPDLQIHLAGKSMPSRIFSLADKQLHVYGRIDDARKFMQDKSVMLVPLLSGGGMRVKIIEGMALGKTIISTRVGAEGIQYSDGINLITADSPTSFFEAISNCVLNKEYCTSIGRQARILAENHYENKVLGDQVLSFYQSVFNLNSVPSA